MDLVEMVIWVIWSIVLFVLKSRMSALESNFYALMFIAFTIFLCFG